MIDLRLPFKIFTAVAFLLPSLGNSQADSRKKLMGKHWAGSCKTMSCDTMEYSGFRKYDCKHYQWGSGYVEGMEFLTNDTMLTFQNVLCSDESSPVNMPSRWELRHDTLILMGIIRD